VISAICCSFLPFRKSSVATGRRAITLQQATTISTNAATTASGLHSQMKTVRQNLATAVQNDATATISQVSTTIGNLVAQEISNQANTKGSVL